MSQGGTDCIEKANRAILAISNRAGEWIDDLRPGACLKKHPEEAP